MHKAFYRIFAMTITIILVFCLCAPCFAAAPALTAAEDLMALWSMYCESVGFSQSFTTNGSYNTVSNPFDSTIASSNMTTLYTEYATIANRVEDLQTTVNWIKSNTEIAISNQQTGAFQFSAGVTEFFDKFSTWVLEDVVGVVKDATTGLFSISDPWFYNTLSTTTALANGVAVLPVSDSWTYQSLRSYGLKVTNETYASMYAGSTSSFIYCFGVGTSVYFCVPFYDDNAYIAYWNNANANAVYSKSLNENYNDQYYYTSVSRGSGISFNVPTYSSLQNAFGAISIVDDATRIQLRPKDRYNEDALGIPDVDATDYVGTRVQEGVTNVPYDEIDAASSTDVLENLLEKVKDLVLSNSGVLSDVSYGTVEPVISPLAPFDLPSFNFNFSGIWHYVVSWIGSIRSGSSFIFSVWNNIPFAMTIPIYATAVVCIVVGVFRKVF